jgi:hypothetical protein
MPQHLTRLHAQDHHTQQPTRASTTPVSDTALCVLYCALHVGDYFGELALLPGGNTRAATVRARSDVSLLVLDRWGEACVNAYTAVWLIIM